MNRSPEIQTELAALSTAVAELPVEVPFWVPQDYFSNFSGVLLQKMDEENRGYKTAPVVRIWFKETILRYAVAACTVGALGCVLYLVSRPTVENPIIELVKLGNSVQLSEESVAQYFVGIDDWTSEAEHAERLAENNLLVDMDHESISSLLSGISEQGINQYLEQQGYSQPMTNFF
jgi:hypothetical protein